MPTTWLCSGFGWLWIPGSEPTALREEIFENLKRAPILSLANKNALLGEIVLAATSPLW